MHLFRDNRIKKVPKARKKQAKHRVKYRAKQGEQSQRRSRVRAAGKTLAPRSKEETKPGKDLRQSKGRTETKHQSKYRTRKQGRNRK